jgi:hypothetical protein
MSALTEPMPRKKPKPPEPLPDFLARTPGEYRQPLQNISDRTGRSMTAQIQMALEMYFRAEGEPFRPNWPPIKPKD